MNSQPVDDELEISLFGPGYGECIVLHLGLGKWMVVDSCWNENHDNPIALEYLSQLGVDAKTQIKIILATHWHDDHIGGLSALLEQSENAIFACSAAFRNKEFAALLNVAKQIKLVEHTSGAFEINKVFSILQERSSRSGIAGPSIYAQEGMLLFREASTTTATVMALSPSAQTITDAKVELGKIFPSIKTPISRLPSRTPNETSVVLQVSGVEIHLLLGADLETSADTRRGWHAVVASSVRPRDPSAVYKIAHHGSENADHESIWSELLTTELVAFLTPFARGIKPLPTDEDVTRIKSNCGQVFSTVWPPTIRPKRLSKPVERTLRESGISRRGLRRKPGHIRLRIPIGSLPEDYGSAVELFDGAQRL